MKKLNLLTVALGMLALLHFSPSNLQAQSYRIAELTISPGIGLASFGLGGNYAGISALPLSVHGEYGLTEEFSGGGFLGVRFWNDPDVSANVAIGLRGTAHIFPLLNNHFGTAINDSRIDAYLSLNLGAEFRSDLADINIGNRFILGPVLGAEYFFFDNLAAFLELGAGTLTYATLGLTIRVGGN